MHDAALILMAALCAASARAASVNIMVIVMGEFLCCSHLAGMR